MATQAQLLQGAEPTFRGPNPNRAATRRFLQRASTTAAGGTTAIVVSLIVYFSMHKGLRPQQRPQHAEQKLDGGTRTSEHCAWEFDHIGSLLASTAGYGTACQDFYAFTCERDRGYSPLEQSIVRASKRVANSKLRHGRNATETAAVLYASCMSSLTSPKVPVRKNAKTIPTALKLRLDNALKKLDTPVAILEAQAFLSREHFPSFLTFWRDPNRVGEHFLDIREPLSTDLAASDLAKIDRELKRIWEYSGRVETVSFQDLVDIDARVTEEDWRRFFGMESLEVSYMSCNVKVRGLKNVKQALTAFFERMDPIGVAVYSLAHALLPEEMLEVHARPRRASTSCLGLVRRVFGNAWHTTMASEMTPVTIVEARQKWTSVANDVAAALKKRIVVSSLFTDYAAVSAAIANINNMQTAATNASNLSPPSLSGLISESLRRSLDPHNLYMNLLAFRRLHNATHYSAYGLNEFDDPRWFSQKDMFGSSGVFTIPRVALTSSFTCEDRFLNYATLGVVVADAMLRAIGGPFAPLSEGGDSCSPRIPPPLRYSKRLRLLDALVLSTTAFQVALEAGQAALGAKLLSSASPEMEMRFSIRYCHHLCDQRHGSDSLWSGRNAALWARLRCNVAVMNSPMFGPLFKCAQKEQVFPTRCSVL
ncbi:hypothetical protein MTO96_038865 [Rhipicephalus appendiculatus]